MNRGLMAALLVGAACLAVPATGQSGDDTNRIIDEGYNRSQVMQTAQEMTDGIGPRLTNSPAMRRAEAWAIGKFEGWGLSNVRRDGFEFGRGWKPCRSARVWSRRAHWR